MNDGAGDSRLRRIFRGQLVKEPSITANAVAADLAADVDYDRPTLHRSINWTGAFWVASGVPALVLFSMGAVAATVGKPAWLVWILSISFGFLQAFTYAEIAGLFPHKTGGASVYGAVAWVRYIKIIAPISVWCNWVAWGPVLAIGSGLAAGYILSALFAPDAVINTWQITLLDLSYLKDGLSLRINATFIIGCALLLMVFAVQNGGILRSARATMILGLTGLLPLMIVGMVPLLTGDMPVEHFFPLTPLAYDESGFIVQGQWDIDGWELMAGGLFIAAWSTYGFETAVCYTREFKTPKRDTFKAIFFSGLLCIAVFTLVPSAFQSHLGLGDRIAPELLNSAGEVVSPAVYDGMLAADIYSGMGVANALAGIIDGHSMFANIFVVMLVLALLLSVMTTMSGASRTLYQGSVDGLLPRYLSQVNDQGAPSSAMWTNLVINLILLSMSDYVFLLAASNVGYIIFNFLNLNAGWIHRMDRANWDRPYRAPTTLIVIGTLLAYFNLLLMGMGANVWGDGTLLSGLLLALMILPVFVWRHYLLDQGVFPKSMIEDMSLDEDEKAITCHAGILPYMAIIAGILVVWLGNWLTRY